MGTPNEQNQFDEIIAQIEDLRSHAEMEMSHAKKCDSIPEIENGCIPTWRVEQFSELERAIYHLGRASAMEFGAEHIDYRVQRQRDEQ